MGETAKCQTFTDANGDEWSTTGGTCGHHGVDLPATYRNERTGDVVCFQCEAQDQAEEGHP
jgi:hypothetical protein